jgi:cytochrome c oxidase cbb3-type subunit 3
MWWVGLFVATIAFGVVYLAYYPGLGNFAGLGTWTAASQLDEDARQYDERFAPLYARLGAMPADALLADDQARQIGRRLFMNNCATCHGTSARGAFGFPDLTDAEWLWGGDFETIKATITAGRYAAMPPWVGALGENGVTDMANYVASLSGQTHDATAAARAAPQFVTFCAACHGRDGRGMPTVGAPDLTNSIWLYGGTVDQIAFTIRNGRGGHMPAQESVLSREKIHVLAGYVASLHDGT